MDGTPVDNNRLVLAPFLNTLTVRASPYLSALSLYVIRVNNESSIKQYCESVGQTRIIEQLDVNITANPNSNYNIIGVNHPAIVRGIPHFDVFSAFFRERPASLALFS